MWPASPGCGGPRSKQLGRSAGRSVLTGTSSFATRSSCAFAALEFEPDMLDYVGRSDSARKPHQQRLNQPPTANVRDWRTELDPAAEAAFEDAAGDLLATLGYERRSGGGSRCTF